MQRAVNKSQRAVLGWLATGQQGPPPVTAYKTCAVALETRGLAKVSRARGVWTATPTEAGHYYCKHGQYPPIEPPQSTPPSEQPPAMPRPVTAVKPAHRRAKKTTRPSDPEFDVDSPQRIRMQGFRPEGDALRLPEEPDPWDSRILISVKEAAWLLSMSEQEIRRAVTTGEVERVFIGAGTTHYRVVYGSLLAWVNDLPRQSPRHRWWLGW